MVRTIGRRVLTAFSVGTALALALAGSVREASACSPPPSGWVPYNVDPIPANGVLVLGYYCVKDCEPHPVAENLVLKTDADEVVPGSVVFTQTIGPELRIAFRPEPGSLIPARQYIAELEGVPPFSELLVAPDVTFSDTLALTDDIREVDSPTGETVCCSGPIDSCGGTPCFRTQVERRTVVDLRWGNESSLEAFQYVFRLTRDGADEPTPWTWQRNGTSFELDETEESACYVLELKRLLDDSVQTYESRCLEQPETFSPGLHTTPEEDVADVLQACDAPPEGYENAWCEARRETCEGRTEEFCVTFAERCEGMGTAGGPNVAGAAGTAGAASGAGGSTAARGGAAGAPVTGGTTSTAGSGGTAGESGNEGGSSGESGGRRVYTEGCGCAVPGRGSRTPVSLVLVALGLVALRRRRTSR
jgi:MYXO-CTERM domain-containing protein